MQFVFEHENHSKNLKNISKHHLRVLGDIPSNIREVDQDSLNINIDSHS